MSNKSGLTQSDCITSQLNLFLSQFSQSKTKSEERINVERNCTCYHLTPRLCLKRTGVRHDNVITDNLIKTTTTSNCHETDSTFFVCYYYKSIITFHSAYVYKMGYVLYPLNIMKSNTSVANILKIQLPFYPTGLSYCI